MTEVIKRIVKQNIDLIKNAKKLSSQPKKDIIRVGFLLQMVEVWDKEIDVFNIMNDSNSFEVVPIIVPQYDNTKNGCSTIYQDSFFDKYPNAVEAVNEDGTVINMESLELDYVFYQRPYNQYLPFELQSGQLSKIAKCCLIPYGFVGAENFISEVTKRNFVGDMYFLFCESDYLCKIVKKKYFFSHMLKVQFFESLGYPCLEKYSVIDRTEIRSILWTPRWCFNKELVRSTFLENRELFLELAIQYNDMEFVFRPHPLMFEEIIKIGKMSREEIDQYKDNLKSNGIKYDSGTMVDEALDNSDLLITDYSSIIINYFLTGKPIIYCESPAELTEEYKKIIDCCYVAKSPEDIKKYCNDLLSGNDPLKEKRIKAAQEIGNFHKGSAKRIVDRVFEDYYK